MPISLLAIFGAITGRAITEDAAGAGLGAGAGLAVALLSYMSFDQSNYAALQDLPIQEGNHPAASKSTNLTEPVPQLEITIL